MHVARFPDTGEGDNAEYRSRMSMRFAQAVSQIMQSCGVSGLRIERHMALSGATSGLADLAMFDGVPEAMSEYAKGVMLPLSSALAAFGVSEVRLMRDEGDDESLRQVWDQLVAPESSPDDDPENLPESKEVQL